MHLDSRIIERFSARAPFDAIDCARALGIEVLFAPSASAVSCQVTGLPAGKRKRRITLSTELTQKSDHAQRFAVSVGIAHFFLHEDLMDEEMHGDALFMGFIDTGVHLSPHLEAQARKYALSLMAPPSLVAKIASDASTFEEAVNMVSARLAIPCAAADITLSTQGHKARFAKAAEAA